MTTGDPSTHARKALLLLLLSLLCVASVPRIMRDVLRLRGRGEDARAVAIDGRAPESERIDGIVAASEDALRTIAMLRQLAELDGPIGQHARNTLAGIAAQVR